MNFSQTKSYSETSESFSEGLRKYMIRIYNTMTTGVATTFFVAFLITQTFINEAFFIKTGSGYSPTIAYFGATLLTLALGLGYIFKFDRLSPQTAKLLFYGYSALNGIWMSYAFLNNSLSTLISTGLTSIILFCGLSLYGYTTKRTLSGLQTFLFMGLIGIIFGSLLNIFLQSPMMGWILTAVSIIVFSGLTAYDTQNLKNYYAENQNLEKVEIYGAFQLYLNLINLFTSLLNFQKDE